jgi:hypothetical protein
MTTSSSTDANKALVLAGIKGVFIDRDPTVLDRLFSDDHRQHNPQIPNGTAAIKTLLGKLPADFKYEPGLVSADGDCVAIHGRYLGWAPSPWWLSISSVLLTANRRALGCHAGGGPAAQSASGNSMLTSEQA